MRDNYKFIMCDCGGQAVCIDHDEDQMFLSFFEHGAHNDNTLSWKERIRWIWNVLKTGRPFSDYIVIEKEKALELGNEILRRAQELKKA